MTNPTDTNQASEDELRAEILTEFKQVHKLAPADYTENCTESAMTPEDIKKITPPTYGGDWEITVQANEDI